MKFLTLLKGLKALPKGRMPDVVYMTSQFSTPVVGFVTSLIAAKYLLPYELGVIQTVILVPSYCAFIHLGVFNGLNRNIAFYEGKGDKKKVQHAVNASWRSVIAIAFIGLLISLFTLFIYYSYDYSGLYLKATPILFGMLLFSPAVTHYQTIYRSCRVFMSLGILLNIRNAINLILGFLPIFLGGIGVILRYAILPVISFILLYPRCPIKAKDKGKPSEIVGLIRVGFPMLLSGVLYTVFAAADKTIVALTLGPEAVGELALSGMVITAIQVLPMSMGALLYPRAAYAYGISGTSRGLRRFFF